MTAGVSGFHRPESIDVLDNPPVAYAVECRTVRRDQPPGVSLMLIPAEASYIEYAIIESGYPNA